MPEAPRRSDARRNGARIVAAAVAAFAEHGAGLRLDDLAARAGVGVATVYRLFGNRDNLVRAAFETVIGEEIAPLAVTAKADPDPVAALRAALVGTLDRLVAHRALFRAAREAGGIRVDTAERFLRDLGEVLDAAQLAGGVRPDAVLRDLAAVLVMALATVHEDDDPEGADPRRYLALLLDGLRPGSAALPPPSARQFVPPAPDRVVVDPAL
jgi:AcrR family transcriptional regulator